MCYASYHVWMGTSTGELRIVDIATHEARFVQTLEPSLTRKRGGTLPSVLEGTVETVVQCSRVVVQYPKAMMQSVACHVTVLHHTTYWFLQTIGHYRYSYCVVPHPRALRM